MAIEKKSKREQALTEAKADAIIWLGKYTAALRQKGYDHLIVQNIWRKKSKMVADAATVSVIRQICSPANPRYNGTGFSLDEYHTVEEELIGWSEASLVAPLSSIATKRYIALFNQAFPEKNIIL